MLLNLRSSNYFLSFCEGANIHARIQKETLESLIVNCSFQTSDSILFCYVGLLSIYQQRLQSLCFRLSRCAPSKIIINNKHCTIVQTTAALVHEIRLSAPRSSHLCLYLKCRCEEKFSFYAIDQQR